MVAFTTIARRLSWALQGAGITCSSHRRSSLAVLPSFDATPALSKEGFSKELPQPLPHELDAPSTPRPDSSHTDSQCYLSSNQWFHMNDRFFSEKASVELLGKGLVGEVWYEYARDAKGSFVPFITKLYDYQLPAGTLGLHVELFLYASWDHLRPLQGKCVPVVIGSFSAPGGKIALLMEPPSRTGWREASMLDSDEIKEKVMAAYATIHAQGVLHNDVELRHILISDEGSVQIIDWQMAKSLQPNDDVGLRACTQKDIDYEARKVKAILNYRDAYAQELELATPLYEMYEQGYPVDRADPRLGWFPHDEFDLMASGYWTEPDPEYTGGRVTVAPLLDDDCVDPLSTNTRRRSKCPSGDNYLWKPDEEVDSPTTIAGPTHWSSDDSTLFYDADVFYMDVDNSPVFPPSSNAISTPDLVPPPPPAVDEDEDDSRWPFLRGNKRAIRQFTKSFGFQDCDISRWSSEEELGPCSRSQAPAPSGELLAKFGPSQANFPLPPGYDEQAASSPRPTEPRLLARHTQWRLTPAKRLIMSPLNPANSRAVMCSRRNVTLHGSEDFVRLTPPRLPAYALGCFGAIVLGSTPESCLVAPPSRTFSKRTLQPEYAPPPPTRSINSDYGLAKITFELNLALNLSDSKQTLSELKQLLDKLFYNVIRFNPGAKPPLPKVQNSWKRDIAELRVTTINCSRLVLRCSDPPECWSARRKYVNSALCKARALEHLIRLYCSSGVAIGSQSTEVPEDSDPSAASRGDISSKSTANGAGAIADIQPSQPSQQESPASVQRTSTQISPAQPFLVDSVTPLATLPTAYSDYNVRVAPRLAQYTDVAVQTSSPEFSSAPNVSTASPAPATVGATSVSESNVPALEPSLNTASSEVIPTSPGIPASSLEPHVLSRRNSCRSCAPYPEPSTRQLRSAVKSPSVIEQETRVITDTPRSTKCPGSAGSSAVTQSPVNKALKTKRRASQAHTSSPAVQPEITQAGSSATQVTPIVTQSRYMLRSRKRSANEESTETSDAQCPEERPLKRRRI